MSTRGRFITLEGGEGSGKSTQARLLTRILQQNGLDCLLTHEPGGTPWGEALRPLIMQKNVHVEEELLLMLADRLHHIRQIIQPALEQGHWVICDRYMDSSLIYQGFAAQRSMAWVQQWHERAGVSLVPDVTFWLQADPFIALQRRHQEQSQCNKFDYADMSFHQRVQEGYGYLAAMYPERYMSVPGDLSLEETTSWMSRALQERFAVCFSVE